MDQIVTREPLGLSRRKDSGACPARAEGSFRLPLVSLDDRVAYCIVDYGTPELAARARNSIREHRPTASVVVVEALGRDFDLGYSEALNGGVRIIEREAPSAEVVVALNADVEMLEPDDAVLHRFRLRDDVAIIGPRQVDAEDRIVHGGIVPDLDGGTVWDLDLHHRYWKHDAQGPRAAAGTRIELEVPTVSGSVMYVRRAVLRDLGGFPEFTTFYYEDTGLSYLARHRGWTVLYTGATTWRHFHEGSPISRAERVERMRIAREQFIFWCGENGIPLQIPSELVR